MQYMVMSSKSFEVAVKTDLEVVRESRGRARNFLAVDVIYSLCRSYYNVKWLKLRLQIRHFLIASTLLYIHSSLVNLLVRTNFIRYR